MIKKTIFWVILLSIISPLLILVSVLALFLTAYFGILYGYAFQPNSLLNEYQKYLYFGGMRAIWQGQVDCIEFDKNLLYVPKQGVCNFKNVEFDTELNFDNNGRRRPPASTNNSNRAVAVVGDSHAMGWGVDDKDTFSYLLEEKKQIPVYNLSVSSYGTYRELLRLEKSGILQKVDVLIIQYCDNDIPENSNFSHKKFHPQEEEFVNMVNSHLKRDPLKRSKDWLGKSLTLAVDKVAKKAHAESEIDFEPHFQALKNIFDQFNWIKQKKVIVIYSNGFGVKFKDFNKYSISTYPNVKFIDMNLSRDNYFKLDDHLNVSGHKAIANRLSDLIN